MFKEIFREILFSIPVRLLILRNNTLLWPAATTPWPWQPVKSSDLAVAGRRSNGMRIRSHSFPFGGMQSLLRSCGVIQVAAIVTRGMRLLPPLLRLKLNTNTRATLVIRSELRADSSKNRARYGMAFLRINTSVFDRMDESR